jgi:hypothetical protein
MAGHLSWPADRPEWLQRLWFGAACRGAVCTRTCPKWLLHCLMRRAESTARHLCWPAASQYRALGVENIRRSGPGFGQRLPILDSRCRESCRDACDAVRTLQTLRMGQPSHSAVASRINGTPFAGPPLANVTIANLTWRGRFGHTLTTRWEVAPSHRKFRKIGCNNCLAFSLKRIGDWLRLPRPQSGRLPRPLFGT